MNHESDGQLTAKRTRNRKKMDEEFIQETYMRGANTRKKMKKDEDVTVLRIPNPNFTAIERRETLPRVISKEEPPSDLLSMIKRFAADPESYEEAPEEREALYKAAEYKQRTQKVVFTEDVFEK
eukprot:TRINITY_DN7702_c0_g2_i1.p3 TRINITY_DN7702_c0_g2~~TRINITY_DN7702_c0_g2_i1.p3  ORF type:complete len:124 (-),score=24.97 TRINITY_DN7702_c0_g2_i1:741-1112(-)